MPLKSAEAQAALLDHKARSVLIRRRTQTVNTIQAHLTGSGMVVAKGVHNVDRPPALAEQGPMALDLLADPLRSLRSRIATFTTRTETVRRADPPARCLATIPGLDANNPGDRPLHCHKLYHLDASNYLAKSAL